MTMKTNRIGKIARLPRVARERLNQRIEDGEPAGVFEEVLRKQGEAQEKTGAMSAENAATLGGVFWDAWSVGAEMRGGRDDGGQSAS